MLAIPSEAQLRCHMCKTRDVIQEDFVKCCRCVVGLCVTRTCFKNYHTKVQL